MEPIAAVAMMLAILVVFAMVVGFGVVVVMVLTQVVQLGKREDHLTPTQQFERDAERLHALVHPEDDERRPD